MPDDAATAEALDPAILRAEWRLRMLEEMAEICMDLGRIVHRQALAAAESADPTAIEPAEAPANRVTPTTADPSAALARISRALRLTLALHRSTDEALRALRVGVVAEREARRVADRNRAAAEAAVRSQRRRDTVEGLVFEAADREIEDEDALEGVLEALEERLDNDEAYQDLERAPLRETVERLCADLELTPDWSLWEGEGWGPVEPFFRPRHSIWRRPSREPLRPFDSGAGGVQPDGPRAHCRE